MHEGAHRLAAFLTGRVGVIVEDPRLGELDHGLRRFWDGERRIAHVGDVALHGRAGRDEQNVGQCGRGAAEGPLFGHRVLLGHVDQARGIVAMRDHAREGMHVGQEVMHDDFLALPRVQILAHHADIRGVGDQFQGRLVAVHEDFGDRRVHPVRGLHHEGGRAGGFGVLPEAVEGVAGGVFFLVEVVAVLWGEHDIELGEGGGVEVGARGLRELLDPVVAGPDVRIRAEEVPAPQEMMPLAAVRAGGALHRPNAVVAVEPVPVVLI